MAYLQFEPSPQKNSATAETVRDDLAHLWQLLGKPAGFPFHLVVVELSPTDAFRDIQSLPKGKAETAPRVIAALRSETLFTFEAPRVETIS